jgi:hypothetical protein
MSRNSLMTALVLFGLISACGTRKQKGLEPKVIPLSVTLEKNDLSLVRDDGFNEESQLSEVPLTPISSEALNSKPLNAVLVLYRIQPSEMSNHVPIRTSIPQIGTTDNPNLLIVNAYPAPSDMNENSGPIPLNNGYFLDRSGFVGAGTRFLDLHYNEYKKVSEDSLNINWFSNHVIPSDAMQFEWFSCECNKGDVAANVKLLNSMINKGIESFKHPEISTQIHPRFGAEFPKK